MKTKLLYLIFLFSSPYLFSQILNSQQAIGQPQEQADINNLHLPFSDLDKSKIETGILLDAGIEFADLKKYNGIPTDSSFTNSTIVNDIYSTLIMSKISANGVALNSPIDFQNQWYEAQNIDLIPIAGHYFKYNEFSQINQLAFQNMVGSFPVVRTSNISTNSLSITPQNKIIDLTVNGVWQNPYDISKLFAMAPIANSHNKQSFNVVFPSSIFLTNYGNEVSSLEVKFSDADNYQQVVMDQTIHVSYPTVGEYIWTYKLTLIDGQILYSKSKFSVTGNLEKYVNLQEEASATGTIISATDLGEYTKVVLQTYTHVLPNPPFVVTRPKLTLYIKLRSGQTKITKPFIVSEGFDTGHITDPRLEAGDNNIDDFLTRNAITSNFSSYLTGNCDVIYVDWGIGTDYIQNNADLFKKAIRWVNQQKIGTAKNVVLGQSMGGLVARFALKDMEDNGENHDTNLFISHDTPHLGANTPISMQYMLRNLSKNLLSSPIIAGLNYMFSPIFTGGAPYSAVLTLADTPASRQMLINYVNNNYAIDNSVHNTWQNTLKAKGYPQLTRNVAISNGSECGTDQNLQDLVTMHHSSKGWFIDIIGALIGGVRLDANQIILSLIPGKSRYYYDFIARPMINQNENKQLFYGKIVYKKDILWVIPAQRTLFSGSRNQPANVLPIDKYGGGKFRFPTSSLPIWLGNYITAKDFSFVPTPSALDYKFGNIILGETEYQKTYSPVDDKLDVPFSNFVAEKIGSLQSENNNHIYFSSRNLEFIINQLSSIQTQQDQPLTTSFLCGSKVVIGGESLLCGTEMATYTTGFAPIIQWSVLNGSNLINITGPTNQPQISFTPKHNANGFVKLQAYLYGDGASNTVTKDIWIGVPKFRIEPDPNNSTNYVTFNAIPEPSTVSFTQMGVTASNIVWKRLDNGQTRIGSSYFAHAPGHNWSFEVEVKATNNCGTFTTYATITPPAAMPCETFTLAQTNQNNNYTIVKSEDPDCPIIPISPNGKQVDQYQITVANSMGTIIISKTGDSFDLNTFPAGMYIVNIKKDSQTIINQTLIKH